MQCICMTGSLTHHISFLIANSIMECFWSHPLDWDLGSLVGSVVVTTVDVPGQAKVTNLHY